MEKSFNFEEQEFFACCGSSKFAKEMAISSPFSSLDEAVTAARLIWFHKVDVTAWLEAFSAHPQIGNSPSPSSHATSAQWSKGEQSTALATATSSSLQELSQWNTKYREKFGFVFLICAMGKSTYEILAELKKRCPNRPIVEFEIAAEEQMKITELRLVKLFSTKENVPLTGNMNPTIAAKKVEAVKTQTSTRTRPPITTHVLDVSRGSPGAGIDVCLEMWKGHQPRPVFGESAVGGWVFQGSSATDNDGRSGQLLSIVDAVNPGYTGLVLTLASTARAGSSLMFPLCLKSGSHRSWNIFMFLCCCHLSHSQPTVEARLCFSSVDKYSVNNSSSNLAFEEVSCM